MWNETRIREYMLDFTENMNDDLGNDLNKIIKYIPIKIDGRLKRTKGEYISKSKTNEPVGFKFSRGLFENYSSERIIGVIEHELMHMAADVKYNAHCKHDRRWKDICVKYGVDNSVYFETDKEKEEYKYTIECQCGKCWKKHRITKYMKENIKSYSHKECSGKLRIIDNKTGEIWS